MALQQAAASNTGLSMEEALAKMRQDEEGRSSNIISVINDQVFRLIVSVQYSVNYVTDCLLTSMLTISEVTVDLWCFVCSV